MLLASGPATHEDHAGPARVSPHQADTAVGRQERRRTGRQRARSADNLAASGRQRAGSLEQLCRTPGVRLGNGRRREVRARPSGAAESGMQLVRGRVRRVPPAGSAPAVLQPVVPAAGVRASSRVPTRADPATAAGPDGTRSETTRAVHRNGLRAWRARLRRGNRACAAALRPPGRATARDALRVAGGTCGATVLDDASRGVSHVLRHRSAGPDAGADRTVQRVGPAASGHRGGRGAPPRPADHARLARRRPPRTTASRRLIRSQYPRSADHPSDDHPNNGRPPPDDAALRL
jgi:hypothetical protein